MPNFIVACVVLCFTVIGFSSGSESKSSEAKTTNEIQFELFRSEIGPLKIGETVELQNIKNGRTKRAIFLGIGQKPNGKRSYSLFLDLRKEEVLFIKTEQLSSPLPQAENVFDPYVQIGGTCTGYAVYGFLMQTHASGFKGTGALKSTVIEEEGRTQLLAGAINEYYLTPARKYSIAAILNVYGKNFGFKCKNLRNDSLNAIDVRNLILTHLKSGSPVLLSFNIGKAMVQAPFPMRSLKPLENVNSSESIELELDSRLWKPRQIGDRMASGHSVVAARTFSYKDKDYLVMIDSNWSEPRIWDLEAFINDRTALKELDIVSCK